jgi:1-Cys peroxiredoxin 6
MCHVTAHLPLCKYYAFLPFFQDILAYTKDAKFDFPIIADPKRDLAVQFGMLDPVEKDSKGLPLTCRAVSYLKCLLF